MDKREHTARRYAGCCCRRVWRHRPKTTATAGQDNENAPSGATAASERLASGRERRGHAVLHGCTKSTTNRAISCKGPQGSALGCFSHLAGSMESASRTHVGQSKASLASSKRGGAAAGGRPGASVSVHKLVCCSACCCHAVAWRSRG